MSTLVKKYFDVAKLILWAETESDSENKRPRLVFSLRDGNPRFVVYTGLMGKEGVINFPCDPLHTVATMDMLRDIANGQPSEKFAVDSLRTVYENSKPTKEKQVAATLNIGKSKDGIVYFCVIAEGRPKIVFPIKSSPFHVFRDSSKNQIPDGPISQKLALAYAKIVDSAISTLLVNYSMDEYTGGKKQGSTDVRGGEAAGQSAAGNSHDPANSKRNLIQDLDDIAL
jgi:hypothetical protein